MKIVSESLGHASASFTMDVYAHILPGMGEQVATAIEAALGGALMVPGLVPVAPTS